MKILLFTLLMAFFFNCQKVNARQINLKQTVQAYFDTYAQRIDFKTFMSFYAQDAKLKDIIYGNDLRNKDEIKAFLNWHNGQFDRLGFKHILTVTNQVIQSNKAITEGYFHQFQFNGKALGYL